MIASTTVVEPLQACGDRRGAYRRRYICIFVSYVTLIIGLYKKLYRGVYSEMNCYVTERLRKCWKNIQKFLLMMDIVGGNMARKSFLMPNIQGTSNFNFPGNIIISVTIYISMGLCYMWYWSCMQNLFQMHS